MLHTAATLCEKANVRHHRAGTMGETGTGKLLTRKEAAEYITQAHFKITARTLAVYASEGIGPPYRLLGGQAHYRRADIDSWVESPQHDGLVAPRRTGALSR